MKRLILVTGATGKQGGAVARHLLGRGFAVRGLTRDAAKPSARALERRGAELVQGDMEDVAALERALRGVYGVFSVQNYWEKGVGQAGEVRQAGNLIRAAAAAGVRHFVQSSIAGCDEAHGAEHIEGKGRIEEAVRAAGLPYTFLRTVWFMENFADPKLGGFAYAVLLGALRPTTRFHMLSVEDVGWFAADALARPEAYLGRTLELAGDTLTPAQIARAYAHVTGRPLPALRVPLWLSRFINREMARQFAWNNRAGWRFDIRPLRETHPGLVSFEDFLRAHAADAGALRRT